MIIFWGNLRIIVFPKKKVITIRDIVDDQLNSLNFWQITILYL